MCLRSFFSDCQDLGPGLALVDPDGTLVSYADLLASWQIWKAYLDNKGIRGTTVAVQADFSCSSIALLLALIENDCILVPIQEKTQNIAFYLRCSGCTVMVHLGSGIELVRLASQPPVPGLLEGLLEQSHPGLVLFSSGSTGVPKGAVHDLRKLLPACLKKGKPMTGLALLLFDHIGGFNTMFRVLSAGGTLVCLPDRRPLTICRAIEKHKVELLPASPSFLNLLLLSGGHERYNLSSLTTITYGTEPMPQALLDKLHRVFPDCAFKQTYGLSELGILPTKSQNSQSLWLLAGGGGVETRVRSGTLHIKSDTAMLGYLNAPSPFDADGWFDTGDKVEVRDGFLKILGRTSEIINVGGEKVYPAEVEDVLMRYPGVFDAKVSGEQNALTGEIVKAEIFVDENNYGSSFKKALLDFCTLHLERYKIPLKIELSLEPFMGGRLKKKRNEADGTAK